MDAKRITALAKSIRKGFSKEDVNIGDMVFPTDVWNAMLTAAAAGAEANKDETGIVLGALKHLLTSDFYAQLVPAAKLYAENAITDYLNKEINSTSPVEEVVTMKRSEFDNLLTALETKILKKVEEANGGGALKELTSQLKKTTLGGNEEILFDPADVLETPAVFFTYAIGMGVMDDTRNGLPVPPPYKRALHFVHMYRQERMGRDRKEFINISACHVASKKEAEWLRNHSLFGIKFFEDITKVATIDVQMQDRLVEAHSEIARLGEHEMVQRAKSEGVPYSSNFDHMRRDLVYKIAEKRMVESGAKKKEVLEKISKASETIKEVSAAS